MTNIEATTSIAQTLLRYRVGAKIVADVTDRTIADTVTEVTNLLNADVYRITVKEALEAELELCRRMLPRLDYKSAGAVRRR